MDMPPQNGSQKRALRAAQSVRRRLPPLPSYSAGEKRVWHKCSKAIVLLCIVCRMDHLEKKIRHMRMSFSRPKDLVTLL